MTIDQKINKMGYKIRCNIGWKNGEQAIISYSAISEKTGREVATETSKTKLLKAL